MSKVVRTEYALAGAGTVSLSANIGHAQMGHSCRA
jgi:hypothetical protein